MSTEGIFFVSFFFLVGYVVQIAVTSWSRRQHLKAITAFNTHVLDRLGSATDFGAFAQTEAGSQMAGPPPSAAFIWWKGQLARRWDAEHRAAVPLRLDECISAGLAALAGVGLAAWRWATSPLNTASTAASIGGVLILVMSAVFVMSDIFSRRSGDLNSPDH
jgi:hypothetical protein